MRTVSILTLALAMVVACDRREEAWVPPEAEPPPPERPVRVPGLGAPVPRAPFVASTDGKVGSAEGARAGVRDGAPIAGVVRLGAGESVDGGAILFIIARSPGGGPPLAAMRLPASGFPIAFEIGPDDVMIKGRPFVGPIQLSARVDVDGDPMTRESAPTASLAAPVEPGATGIDLVLQGP